MTSRSHQAKEEREQLQNAREQKAPSRRKNHVARKRYKISPHTVVDVSEKRKEYCCAVLQEQTTKKNFKTENPQDHGKGPRQMA